MRKRNIAVVGFTADGDVFGAEKKERTRKQRLVLRGRFCDEGKTPQRREEASGRAMRPAGRLLAVLHGSGTSGQPTRCGEASLHGLFSLKRTILTLWSFVSVVSEKRPETKTTAMNSSSLESLLRLFFNILIVRSNRNYWRNNFVRNLTMSVIVMLTIIFSSITMKRIGIFSWKVLQNG